MWYYLLSWLVLFRVQDHTAQKKRAKILTYIINCVWKSKCQILTCMFSAENLTCTKAKQIQSFFYPLNPFCPALLPWNCISIILKCIEVMMAWNYGCLSRPYSLLCSPSLWVQGSSLQLRPSSLPSFSPTSPSFSFFALSFYSKWMCNWIWNWVPFFQGPQLMRRFALKSRLDGGDPDGRRW